MRPITMLRLVIIIGFVLCVTAAVMAILNQAAITFEPTTTLPFTLLVVRVFLGLGIIFLASTAPLCYFIEHADECSGPKPCWLRVVRM
jgi:hypothetical protein